MIDKANWLLMANGGALVTLATAPAIADHFEVTLGVLASACLTLAGTTLWFIRRWMGDREKFEAMDLAFHRKMEQRLDRIDVTLSVLKREVELEQDAARSRAPRH